MVRICYFVSDITAIGGIERVVSNLTLEQANDSDLDITIVSEYRSFYYPNYQFDTRIRMVYLQDAVLSNSPGSFTRLKQHLVSIRLVRKFFMNNEFDLILAQSFPMTFILWCAGLDMSRVIGVEHVNYGYYGKVIRSLRHYIYKRLYCLVVITSQDEKDFCTEGLTRVTTIFNPIDLSKRSHSPLISKKIISVGRLVSAKGFDTLVEIFRKVHDRYPDWQVEIYGEGVLHDVLQKQIDEAGLSACFKLMGVTDKIEDAYRSASIFVCTSRYEGFSMVLAEAMSQGLACISFDCPTGPSILLSGEQVGILVENQNQLEFENALLRLMEDDKLRRYLGTNAYASVERFDVCNICREWKKLYLNFSN